MAKSFDALVMRTNKTTRDRTAARTKELLTELPMGGCATGGEERAGVGKGAWHQAADLVEIREPD
jgi:hypothetical protein